MVCSIYIDVPRFFTCTLNGTYNPWAVLYNGMLIDGVSPSELPIGTMVQLQKDKRTAHHSFDNYRALTLGSIIGKLYDASIIVAFLLFFIRILFPISAFIS